MEGPSILIAKEQLKAFEKRRIKKVSGNTKIGKERLEKEKLLEVFSFGKELLCQFDSFALRTHFLLYGSYELTVNGFTLTGDYRKTKEPRLKLEFSNGNITMYNCSLRYIESSDVKKNFDFSSDVLSDTWNPNKAFEKVMIRPKEFIADVLLDQEIFAGVGNIIKNEVLYLTKVNPFAKVSDLTEKEIKEVVNLAGSFSWDFYRWRKIGKLKKNLKVYRKPNCGVCKSKIMRRRVGKRERISFYCPNCQISQTTLF